MHSAQPMHSSWLPSRMSMPVGQTATHWLQSTQWPRPSQLSILVVLAARLAAPFLIGDDQRVFVEHRRLDARPRAHIGADLLARPAGEQIGRRGEQADEEIGGGRGLAGHQLPQYRRRIVEIEDPGAAGDQRDEQPCAVLGDLLGDFGAGGPALVELDARVAVALDPALDHHEEVGPHRLRAGIAAPDAPGQAGHEEQADGGQDEQAGQVVDLLRPDLDEEEIGAPVGQVDQHGLVGHARAPVPAHPGQDVVDGEEHAECRPLDLAEGACDALRIDAHAVGVERAVLLGPRR